MSATTDNRNDVSFETARDELETIYTNLDEMGVTARTFDKVTIDDDSGEVSVRLTYPSSDIGQQFEAETGNVVENVYYEIAGNSIHDDVVLYVVFRVVVERGLGPEQVATAIERRELEGSVAHPFPQALDYAISVLNDDMR